MLAIKSIAANLLYDTPLYDSVRDAYHILFNRSYWTLERARLNFYKQFIRPGCLVFDVGANAGEYSRTFLRLRANVVAVEPNPDCLGKLRGIRPKSRFKIEPVAVGEKPGRATFFCGSSSPLATVSKEWIDVASHSKRFAGQDWKRKLEVEMTTMNELIRKHGSPFFIKIDVEGYEKEVLFGLSDMPPYLSFEFNAEFLDAVDDCLGLPVFQNQIECNIVLGEPRELHLAGWLAPTEIRKHLRSMDHLSFGDIIVRRKNSP
jgi:FkbM family methyltransferase